MRPFREIEEQRAVECPGDVQIAHRKCGTRKPRRFRERDLQYIERLHDFLPRSVGDFLFTLGFRKLFGMPDVIHELAIETVGLPQAPLQRERLTSVRRIKISAALLSETTAIVPTERTRRRRSPARGRSDSAHGIPAFGFWQGVIVFADRRQGPAAYKINHNVRNVRDFAAPYMRSMLCSPASWEEMRSHPIVISAPPSATQVGARDQRPCHFR